MEEIISCIIRPGIYFHDKSATRPPKPETTGHGLRYGRYTIQ